MSNVRTPLKKTLKRGISIKGENFTIIISREGIGLRKKRFRHGRFLTWDEFYNGTRPSLNTSGTPPLVDILCWKIPAADLTRKMKNKTQSLQATGFVPVNVAPGKLPAPEWDY